MQRSYTLSLTHCLKLPHTSPPVRHGQRPSLLTLQLIRHALVRKAELRYIPSTHMECRWLRSARTVGSTLNAAPGHGAPG